MIAVAAIVGRANVGKSTLFNRLLGRRRAIVHDRPGVTRDRVMALATLGERQFWLIDTGGLGARSDEFLGREIGGQARRAMEEASIVLFVVDAREGLTASDEEITRDIRRLGKPVIFVANKVDPGSRSNALTELYRAGLGQPLQVSAEHSIGIEELRQKILAAVPPDTSEEVGGASGIRVAFLGRPNVGKSSLINRILNEPRMIVSEMPGTTRDVVDVPVTLGDSDFVLLDTAGLRRRGKVDDRVEYFSAVQTLKAIDRADVVVLVLDAEEGLTTQDERIGSAAVERGTGLILAANKWDLCSDREEDRHQFREEAYATAPFLEFSPIRFVSALTGKGVEGLLLECRRIFKNRTKRFAEAELSKAFTETAASAPSVDRLRLSHLSQAMESHPTFFLWCSDPRRVRAHFERYWVRALGPRLRLEGVPIRVVFRRLRVSSKKAQGRRRATSRRARS